MEISTVNSQFEQAIESAMDGIALLDHNGIYYYVNLSHAIGFGYENPMELIGKSWQTIYADSEIKRISNEIFPLLIQDGSWSGETLGKKKDGTPVFQEITLSLLCDKGLICICRNITQRKIDEVKLNQLAIVAQKTNSIVIVENLKKEIIWVNDSFERVLGYSLKDIIGTKTDYFFSFNKNTGKEFKFLTKNKKVIWLSSERTAINDSNGNLDSYIYTQTDITAVKNTLEKLENAIAHERELNNLKTEFITLVSHQIRTPLSAIQSSIDLLGLKLATTDHLMSARKYFEESKLQIDDAVKYMSGIMENILEVAALQEQEINIQKKEQSLKLFMNEFVNGFNQSNNKDPRKLEYYFNANDIKYPFDALIISNIINNILSNAFKYSTNAPSKAPRMTVSYEEKLFVIRIVDFGIGISKKDMKNIFTPFFRSSSSMKMSNGTGLGLPIAYKLISLHNGKIFVESKINKGTIVTITI